MFPKWQLNSDDAWAKVCGSNLKNSKLPDISTSSCASSSAASNKQRGDAGLSQHDTTSAHSSSSVPLLLSCEVNKLARQIVLACYWLSWMNSCHWGGWGRARGWGSGGASEWVWHHAELQFSWRLRSRSRVKSKQSGRSRFWHNSQSASTWYTLGHLSRLSDSDNRQQSEPSEPPLQELDEQIISVKGFKIFPVDKLTSLCPFLLRWTRRAWSSQTGRCRPGWGPAWCIWPPTSRSTSGSVATTQNAPRYQKENVFTVVLLGVEGHWEWN